MTEKEVEDFLEALAKVKEEATCVKDRYCQILGQKANVLDFVRVDESMLYFYGERYIGCGDYDRQELELPIHYLYSTEWEERLRKEQEEKRKREEERKLQQERQRVEEVERKERELLASLQKKYASL